MARRSPHEHLKPEIFRWLGSGLKPSEVCAKYPDIPTATVYAWRKEWQLSADSRIDEGNSRIDGDNSRIAAKSVTVEVVESGPSNGKVLPPQKKKNQVERLAALPSKESDYWRIRREAVAMSTSASTPDYVRVQAIAATCKLLELERDLPQHIIEQQTEQSVSDERDRVRDQSVGDIAKQYKEAMG